MLFSGQVYQGKKKSYVSMLVFSNILLPNVFRLYIYINHLLIMFNIIQLKYIFMVNKGYTCFKNF